MKKNFLVILAMLFMLPVMADTVPFYIGSIPEGVIGMYQTDKELTLFSHPEANSQIIKKMDFSYSPETMPDNVFCCTH